ncbi:hypothetical protein ACLBWT_18375 [Paenibacillus sp. D51F]
MNGSLNAIFRPADDSARPQAAETPVEETKAPVPVQRAQKPKERVRRERADKKKDIKFPVTPVQREELRRIAKELRIEHRQPGRKYETISNTDVLKKALEHQRIFPERYPPLLYEDTGQYMHADPLLPDYEQIEELALKWNMSLRKTAYRLIMNFIYRGEVDSVAYRAGR